jgi:hypothetical protein
MSTGSARVIIPPVLTIRVEKTMDSTIARNTARRAASLLGFSIAMRAQIANAVATLAETILTVGAKQTINLHGVRQDNNTGIQIGCDAPWLVSASADNPLAALRTKLGDLVDEFDFDANTPPRLKMVLWLSAERSIDK